MHFFNNFRVYGVNNFMIIQAFASGSLLLLAFICFTNPRRVNVIANKWLALLFFSAACYISEAVIAGTGIYSKYPQLIGVSELTRLLMAPALYLSVSYFTSPDRTFKRRELLHFIPFLLFLLYRLPALFQPADVKLYNLTHPAITTEFEQYRRAFLQFFVKFQFLVYWVWSYKTLLKHKKHVYLYASHLEPVNLKWLRYLLLGFVCMLALWVVTSYFRIDLLRDPFPVYMAAIFFIAYHVLKQDEIFPFRPKDLENMEAIFVDEEKSVRQKAARLNEIALETGVLALDKLMVEKELFLDPELSLPGLAQIADLSTHDLSYLLNEGHGKNFYSYVNQFRTEKAKMLLISPKYSHLSMIGIAYECGFNSKTVFNTTFKKITGLTPTAFKQNNVAAPDNAVFINDGDVLMDK